MNEFTTKQIAEILGVSKPTVQKAIHKLAVKPDRTDNVNRAYYSYADTVAIIKTIRPSFNEFDKLAVGEKPPTPPPTEVQNTDKPQSEVQTTANQTAKPPSAEIELLQETISIIKAQLEEKDKQIAVKDKQIQDLSDRLAEAMQLTKGQQYIAAADKTTELLEADTKRTQMQEPPIVVSNSGVEDAEGTASSSHRDQNTGSTEQAPQKKSFWQRLFGL